MIKFVIGVDESGAGALAGNLIVAAVAFPRDMQAFNVEWDGSRGTKTLKIKDSKTVKNAAHRLRLSGEIRNRSSANVIIHKTADEIDDQLFGAAFPEALQLAAARCLEQLKAKNPGLLANEVIVLVDGDVPKPNLPCEVECIPGGDASDWRISAASLLAKAAHDVHISVLHDRYPTWSFDKHRGYPTKHHKELLALKGPTPFHRRSFKPVRDVLPKSKGIE